MDDEPTPEGGHTLFTDGHASQLKFVGPGGPGMSSEEADAWLSQPVVVSEETRARARAYLAGDRTIHPEVPDAGAA